MTKEEIRDTLLNKIERKLRLEITCKDIKNLAEAYAAITQRDAFESIYKSISGNACNSCMPKL